MAVLTLHRRRALVEKLVLEDLGDGRTRLVALLVDSSEDRDAVVASGMEELDE